MWDFSSTLRTDLHNHTEHTKSWLPFKPLAWCYFLHDMLNAENSAIWDLSHNSSKEWESDLCREKKKQSVQFNDVCTSAAALQFLLGHSLKSGSISLGCWSDGRTISPNAWTLMHSSPASEFEVLNLKKHSIWVCPLHFEDMEPIRFKMN